jgi:RHS repeat-associated protein
VNRDGLPDAVCKDLTALNSGVKIDPPSIDTVWEVSAAADVASPFDKIPLTARLFGDVDGDGRYDSVTIHRPEATCLFPQPGGCFQWRYAEPKPRAVAVATGRGYVPQANPSFLMSLAGYLQTLPVTRNTPDPSIVAKHIFSLADLNADGLVDFVLNHEANGGQLLVNSGTGWIDLLGRNGRQNDGGPEGIRVPAVPTDVHPINPTTGTAWVDLDGDGVTDLVRTQMLGGTRFFSEAWRNTYRPPTISSFPAGLARSTAVSYKVITTAEGRQATTAEPATYVDDAPLAAGTTFLSVPLRVVSSASADDGTGLNTVRRTTYTYHSLRGSALGRGPQGFRSIDVRETVNNVTTTTTTTYAQAFPYTGMTISVTRRKGNADIATTSTEYCDRVAEGTAEPQCTPHEGPAMGQTYPPPGRSVFVYPKEVTDVSILRGNTSVEAPYGVEVQRVTTTSTFRYDDQGNPTETVVTIDSNGESHRKTTTNGYGDPGSPERRFGKIKEVTVTAERLAPQDENNDPITHHTTFDYESQNSATVPILDLPVPALALTKKIIAPGRQWPTELHTAYAYDGFGNTVVTTTCQNDFADCRPDAENPRGVADPPFRTTKVSFDPAEFTPAAGAPISSLNYGNGRFPVKMTNSVGHTEYHAYDPIKGVLLQQTGPDGIHTCREYDDFVRHTAETTRCGSAGELRTQFDLYRVPVGSSAGYSTVTVTTPPTGEATASWSYADVFGRLRETKTRGFDGGLHQTALRTYDVLGRVATEAKPRSELSGGPLLLTTFVYDALDRIERVTQDLGSLEAAGPTVSDVVSTVYRGLELETRRTVRGELQVRTERKSVTGQVVSVVDTHGAEIRYAYDGEGSLTDTLDPAGNRVHIEYDERGRKRFSRDPDMGEWRYEYNGFGDLIGQIDANGRRPNGQPTIAMTYDGLGRMTSRTDTSGTAQWVYDTAAGAGVGKLAAMVSAPDSKLQAGCTIPGTTMTDGDRAGRSFAYTGFGELATVTECTDGITSATDYQYDPFGRQEVVRYPLIGSSRLAVRYHYTRTGYLRHVTDDADGDVYWAATSMNALGQVTGEYTRNGVVTARDRNPATGWLLATSGVANADGGILIQDWGYGYDEAGNLRGRRRADRINAIHSVETFGYDRLNRLTSSTVTVGAQQTSSTYDYDQLGNLTLKDGADYAYTGCMAGPRTAGPHAVCTVNGGARFNYDANGNMLDGNGRSVAYNSANRPTRISRNGGAAVVEFAYGADGHRVLQSASAGGTVARTVYVGLGDAGRSLYERTTRGTSVEHVQFIYAGGSHDGHAFALRVTTETSGTPSPAAMKYYHRDHLGSVTAMSDEVGHVVGPETGGGAAAGVLGYDPWGARRSPDGQPADPASFQQQVGHREFTGHEAIPDVGLVNMNGRVYDPMLGRFLSPDPEVQFVADLQSYNRYSYVLNNPLRYTDPTGYRIPAGAHMLISLGLQLGGAIACAGGVGIPCVALMVASTVYSTTAMVLAGATFDQIVYTNLVGIVSSRVGGAIGEGVARHLGDVVGGMVASAVSSTISTAYLGGDLGENVLHGVATGAFLAGVEAAAREVQLSQAPIRSSYIQRNGARYVMDDSEGVVHEDVLKAGLRDAFRVTVAEDIRLELYEQGGIRPTMGPLDVMSVGKLGMVLVLGGVKFVTKTAVAYSVAFQVTIPRLGIGTRAAHFKAANDILRNEMRLNPELAKIMDELGISVPTKGKSPFGWSWHHVPDRPGVLQLVPINQHQGSLWQHLLHPNRRGGFKLWGAEY